MIDPSMNEFQHLEIREKHYKFNERREWLENNGIDAEAARNFVTGAGIMHPINQAQLKEALKQIEEYAVRGFTATRIAGEFWGEMIPLKIQNELEKRGFLVRQSNLSQTTISW